MSDLSITYGPLPAADITFYLTSEAPTAGGVSQQDVDDAIAAHGVTEAAARVAGDAASVATASSDATTKASAAQAAAVATASSDATAKADAAKIAAIAAASVDAAAQASAAQAAAIAAAATDATTKANAAQAFAIQRSNHTGAQAISTVTGLQTALDGKAASGHTHPGWVVLHDLTTVANGDVSLNVAGYRHIRGHLSLFMSSASFNQRDVYVRVNGDTSTLYTHGAAALNATGIYLGIAVGKLSGTTDRPSLIEFDFLKLPGRWLIGKRNSSLVPSDSTTATAPAATGFTYQSTADVTTLDFRITSGGTIAAGSHFLIEGYA